jgi:hypothetical protein
MAQNLALEELKKDRALLADQVKTLDGGRLQLGTPQTHEERLIWLRGQIVALDIAISKIEGPRA